jgi:hypothetical protein
MPRRGIGRGVRYEPDIEVVTSRADQIVKSARWREQTSRRVTIATNSLSATDARAGTFGKSVQLPVRGTVPPHFDQR